jgi:hypothetical protein
MDENAIKWGPCCFCAGQIKPTSPDPCRVTVTTAEGKWQVWFCHGRCFRERLAETPDNPGFFDPAHF